MNNLTVYPQLVALVLVITFFTWFVFLDVCSRLHAKETGLTRFFWWIGPILLGIPLWSIYFIARLSINTPILISQHWSQVLLTVGLAILICWLALLFVVVYAHRLLLQCLLSIGIAVLFALMHSTTLYIEGYVQWFGGIDNLYYIVLLGSLVTFVLLRVALFLKHSNHTKQVLSAIIVTLLVAVMYILELPHFFLLYAGERSLYSDPLFDNIAFGYAVGLTAFTLLIMLMVGIWFSRTHTLISKPTKTLRLGVLVIALGMVTIVTTTRWLIEHTLSQDIIAMYMLDHIEHQVIDINQDAQKNELKHQGLEDLLAGLKRFEGVVVNVKLLASGGQSTEENIIAPLRDLHMIYDLETLIYLIQSLTSTTDQTELKTTNVMERLAAISAIIEDVQVDMRIAINNDRTMLAWSNYSMSFIMAMMFMAFSWLISRGWYAIEAKNKQLEKLVEKRTEEMGKVLNDLDVQMSELASNNAKISLLNEALAELRDYDYLYDEGEHKEFYGIILLNVIRVIDASFAFYIVYNENRDIQSKYLYGDSRLKEQVVDLVFSSNKNRLNEMLSTEKVSLKIDDVHTDRITQHDITQDNLLKCFLEVPVIEGNQVSGTIGFFNKENAVQFSDDDEILMNIFASHLAHVLERHRFLKGSAGTS